MIPFVIVACLTADPAICTQHVAAKSATLEDCRSLAESRVVLWSRDHRDRQVTAAYCMPQRPAQAR